MFVSDCLGVNDQGHLTIGGCDTLKLAETFGTPLYVMDEEQIRRNCRQYRASIETCYQGRGLALYASKAFSCKEICRIVREEGLGLDVVSGGELYTAIQAGFPAERIHFHGNNKTSQELEMALDAGVGRFVVDNDTELECLDRLAGQKGKVAGIALRIKPGVEAHTHECIQTGQNDSKFGFTLENGEAFAAIRAVQDAPNLCLKELHSHIGSQIFEVEPFLLATEKILGLMARAKRELGMDIPELNLGGGFGIQYVPADQPVPIGAYMEKISQVIAEKCREWGLDTPYIYMEPGRSIVGQAGITLYRVGSVKTTPAQDKETGDTTRTYVSVDGGMTDNPRYALYQSEYTVVAAQRAADPAAERVTIAGRCCESGDLIQKNILLQKVSPGDVLAVLSTGAYNYSMASNYNRIPRPAVVMVRNGQPRIVVQRESYEDLIRNDI